MTIKRIITICLLTVVLFVFPIGSWFYLRDGVRYRKERLAQLSDFGYWGATGNYTFRHDTILGQPMTHYTPNRQPWSANLTNGLACAFDSLQRDILVANVFDPQSPISAKVAVQMQRIQAAFGEERTDIKLLSIPAKGIDSTAVLPFASKYEPRANTWFLAYSDPYNIAQSLYPPTQKGTQTPSLTQGVLIDQYGTIRQYYDLTNPKDVNRLIEIISIIMRPKPSPKIKFRRRGEK